MTKTLTTLCGLMAATLSLHAAPVTTDLWDSSQPGFSFPQQPFNQGGSGCGSLLNIFGATGFNGCGATFSDNFIAFGFGDANDTTQVQWNTANVTIGSFAFYSPSDFGGPEREVIRLKLFSVDAGNVATEIFDSGPILHNPPNDGTTPLIAAILNSPVTSSTWRAQFFSQPSSVGGPIYQIIELDGFAPAVGSNVPEPSTAVLAGLGVIAALWRRRAR